jgi:hypothetical protein
MKKMMIVFDQSDVKKIQTRLIVDVVEWFRALDIRLSDWCLQCINGVSSNPVEGRTKI